MKKAWIPGTNQIIYIREKGFNFGIDSILLSSFAKMKKNTTLLDIGTGTGILALRCRGLYHLKEVTAFEIQEDAYQLAKKSVEANDEPTHVIFGDFREFREDFREIDYIISNPPYLKKDAGLLNLEKSQLLSRMEIKMSLENLFSFSSKSLKSGGSLFLIHRPHRLPDLFSCGEKYGFEVKRLQMVQPHLKKDPNLVLLECVKGASRHLEVEKTLVVYDENGNYTKEIEEIYDGR